MDNNLTPPTQPIEPRRNPLYTIIFVIVVLAIVGAVWYYIAGNQYPTSNTAGYASPAATTSSDSAAINDEADLQANQDQLEAVDMTPIDTTLTENDADLSTF